jgi:hypothetical protein
MQAEDISRTSRCWAAAGAFAATVGVAAAMLPTPAEAEVVTPHAVTAHVVTPHAVTPPPASSPAPAPSPPPAPAPSAASAESAAPAPALSQPPSVPPVSQPSASGPRSPKQKRAAGDDGGPDPTIPSDPDPQTGRDWGHLPWGWLSSWDVNGIPGLVIQVPWTNSEPPLFGWGWEIPAPNDGEKPSPISSDLSVDIFFLGEDLKTVLSDAHKSVTDPTNTNIFPPTPVPDPSAPTPSSTGPDDPTQNPGSDSDGGGAMYDSGGGGGGGGGLIDDGDVSNQAD